MNEEYKYTILLIEDNPGDVRLTQEFLKDNKHLNKLFAVFDGDEGMKYLRKEEPYHNEPFPSLVILDLNLPKKNGFEVLKEIKTDKQLKHLPVIILTSSESENDIQQCYDLHANCYISKPVDFENFAKLFNSLIDFWCRMARVPKVIDNKNLFNGQ
jgi:chemotaxis family two-component system response regulator Rcp1